MSAAMLLARYLNVLLLMKASGLSNRHREQKRIRNRCCLKDEMNDKNNCYQQRCFEFRMHLNLQNLSFSPDVDYQCIADFLFDAISLMHVAAEQNIGLQPLDCFFDA